MVKGVIKKLGMEKEFSNWVKGIKITPRVGAKVRVKKGAHYGITIPGSEGIIRSIIDYEDVGVEFYKIGPRTSDNSYFTIHKKDLEVIR